MAGAQAEPPGGSQGVLVREVQLVHLVRELPRHQRPERPAERGGGEEVPEARRHLRARRPPRRLLLRRPEQGKVLCVVVVVAFDCRAMCVGSRKVNNNSDFVLFYPGLVALALEHWNKDRCSFGAGALWCGGWVGGWSGVFCVEGDSLGGVLVGTDGVEVAAALPFSLSVVLSGLA